MFQIRPAEGGMPYAPARDIAHCWTQIVREVALRLEIQPIAALKAWLDAAGVCEDDLGLACKAFCEFCITAHTDPDEDLFVVLKRVGWFDVKPEAQVAYLTYLGQAATGMFFHGIREATQLGREASVDTLQLRACARRALLLLSMSQEDRERRSRAVRWRNWFNRWAPRWLRRRIYVARARRCAAESA